MSDGELVQDKPKKPKPSPIHVDDRHGSEWPRIPRRGSVWTGWLTHREYNFIEASLRYEQSIMYDVARYLDSKDTNVERIFYTLVDAGVLFGSPTNYSVTAMAKILFDMTDQYMLQIDLGDED